jgi:hypothetical protein
MLVLLLIAYIHNLAAMPAPFYRELYVTKPMMSGNDVLIAQTLLLRFSVLFIFPLLLMNN